MKSLKTLLFVLTFAYSFSAIGQTVYTTKTGEKFHKSSCNYLKYSKIAMSLEDAISYGYDACKVCKPTNKVSSSSLSAKINSGNSKPQKTNAAAQCTGKTKAGKRCKRKTKSANGRCYQH